MLSDLHGARLLGRLLWGLSYQRRPGTLVVIDRRFLVPNPFDAEPAAPIALVQGDLTRLTARVARHLRLVCGAGPVEGTVRWQTWGLDRAVKARRIERTLAPDLRTWRPPPPAWGAEVDMLGGMLVFGGAAGVLRDWAVDVGTLGDFMYRGMDYTEIDHPSHEPCRSAGEVQIFTDFRRRVGVAIVARREVIARTAAALTPAEIRELVWDHSVDVEARRT